jgi:hypothetical protein
MRSLLTVALFFGSCSGPFEAPKPPIETSASWSMHAGGDAHAAVVEVPSKLQEPLSPSATLQAACTGPQGQWRCKGSGPALPRSLIATLYPPAWNVRTWFVDGQDVTGAASDLNDCTTRATPCLNLDEIVVHRWGTDAPRLAATGSWTLDFLSSQLATDLFRVHATFLSSANPVVQCEPSAVGAGTLSGVTPTARSNNAPPLVATLTTTSGSVAPGMLILDTTANAVFWATKNDGGDVWEFSPPYAPANLTTHSPTAQVVVAEGDAVTLMALPVLNAEEIKPSGYQTFSSMIIDRCQLGRNASTTMTTGPNVDIEESSVQSYWRAEGPIMNRVPWAFNDTLSGAGFVQLADDGQYGAPGYEFIGGQAIGCGYMIGNLLVDGDFVADTNLALRAGNLGAVYETACTAINVLGQVLVLSSRVHGGLPILYGPANSQVFVHGDGTLYYRQGAGNAVATFPLGAGLRLNGLHTAVDTSVDPYVFHSRSDDQQALVAHLDQTIAEGGYGLGDRAGCAYGLQAAICNISP